MTGDKILAGCGILLLAGALVSAPAFAHAAIVVDGVTNEWFGHYSPSDNTARIARRADGAGELVWRDALGDARGSAAARACDLREFRVAGDVDRLYLTAACAGPVPVSGDSAWQVQVAIDLNRFFGLGAGSFLGTGAAGVSPGAAWEFAVQTRFGSAQPPLLMDSWGNAVSADVRAAVNAAGSCEISIPWSALGLSLVPADPIRLSVASFLTDAADAPLDPTGSALGLAADVVTQYDLAPGGSTETELADGVLDYSLDVYFDGRGACIAPIVVSEVFFEGGVHSQWIEIVNVSSSLLPLNQFKVGDADAPGSNEAMGRFPSGLLLQPGGAVVVAFRGTNFFADQGFRADAECDPSDPATPDMVTFTPWASDAGFHVPSGGDAVLVLDRANTVLDVVTYKNASYPGVIARAATPALHSLERDNPNVDTDNCAVDFADQATPTPRVTMRFADVPGGPGAPHWVGAWPSPSAGAVRFALQLGGQAVERIELVDVSGRLVRSLPLPVRARGPVTTDWDGRDSRGMAVPAGIYFARVRAGGQSLVQKLVIAR